ncbi:MAG: hypothetical protein ABII79_12735 [bacterium]
MEARGCARTVALALTLYVGATIFSTSIYATVETKYPEFKAECNVEIIGEPKPGEPFEVVFTFAPLVDCYHTRGVPDEAFLRSENGVTFLGGDTVWTGLLEKGNTYSLRARYSMQMETRFRFWGKVVAMEVIDAVPRPAAPEGQELTAIKCVAGTGSTAIDFRPEEQKRGFQKIPVLQVTDTGLIELDSVIVSQPSEFARTPGITWDTDSQIPNKTKDKKRTREDARRQLIRKTVLPIKLDSSVLDTIRITYDEGREYVFVTDSSVDLVDVELLQGRATFKRTDHKQGAFELEADSAFFRVSAGSIERVLLIRKGDWYWIEGDPTYRDLYSNDYPQRHIVFYIDTSDDGEVWDWIGSDVTDGTGHIAFSMNSDWVRIFLISENALTDVVYADDHEFSPDDALFWVYRHGVQIYNPEHGDVYIPDEYLRITDLWKSGAFSILDYFSESQDLISIDLGESGLPPFTGTIWDDQDGTKQTSGYGSFLWDGVPGFYIASRANEPNYNWDEWDLAVLCHEYAHHMTRYYMEQIPEAGGAVELPICTRRQE